MANLIRPFKALLLSIVFLWTGFTSVFAQDPVISLIEKARIENAQRGMEKPGFNRATPQSFSPVSLRNSVPKRNLISAQPEIQRVQDANCVDSSFLKVFEATDRAYSFGYSAKTRDGGMLLGGFGRSKLEGPPYKWYAVLTKFDSAGNHIWSKEIKSDIQTSFVIENISELSDGSIIINGWHENPLSTSPPTVNIDFFVAKLSSLGSLIWLKTFHSLLGNGCTTSNVRYASIAEGVNGDIFLAGTIPNCPAPMHLLVFKISSAGNIVWQYSMTTPAVISYCLGIFYDGSYLTIVNRSEGGPQGSIFVDLLRLTAATGTYISHKAWIPHLPYPDNFWSGLINWTPETVRLVNGNYCVYGQTFGDFTSNTNDQPHFAILEFNGDYDYIKGYTINSALAVNSYDSKIQVDRFGRVVYSLTDYTDYLNKVKHIGAANNGMIVHQRKRAFQNTENFYDNVELFDDGSFVYINNLSSPGQDNFYLHYSLLHNSDTSSFCLGYADDFSYTAPIQYIPYDFNWSNINPSPLITTNNQGNTISPIVYTASPPCHEKSFCDTVKIHGAASSCGTQQVFTLTAFKNLECGSRINWMVDPSLVQLFQQVNDTTLQVQFNQPWQGWLYAEIITGCGLARDSIYISILSSPGVVNIGPDTTICPSNSIILNARRGYATYQWSNGTMDSTLVVTSSGTYYVDVIDACGNFFSDTVVVLPAPAIPFDIGPDRAKCNNDTLHLAAPAGFLNYDWGPAYNINTQAGQQVTVQPLIDTIYFIKAEKTPGCFAYDTVRIKVNQSPLINLGADKSFCSGDSALLNAGTGFTQYQWNNSSSSQQIIVHAAGNYSVTGTTTEGCKSYDTLRIMNVWPNPVVSLNDDPELCTGSTRMLQAGNFSSYLWQDRSSLSSFNATGIGTYYVTVTDNNQCRGSDTIHIIRLLPLPANFLPIDTAICNYGSLLIKPTGNYSNYTWSNNAVSSSISITVPGIYWLQVTDASNCTGRDSIIINPKECLKGFYIPNAFTPNHNGRNDDFKPFIGGVVKQYQFTIYNRWGQVVFTTKDLYRGWDGNFGGAKQDTNVFAWICSYQLEGEGVIRERGTVVLIR